MSKTFTLLCCSLTLFFLSATIPVSAQILLWPGDINNNGEVNGKDVLRWGYAYGATGTGRLGNGSIWQGLNLAVPWSKSFPGETNFSFADCDGNGRINTDDVRNVLDKHFYKVHGTVTPDYCPVGNQNNSPRLQLTSPQESFTAGSKIELALSLGTENRPVTDFYGVALRIKFNKDLVRPGAVTYTPAIKGWYDPGGTASYSFFHHNPNEGVLEIAVTRLNQKGVNGWGFLGQLTLILRGSTELTLPGALNLEIDLVQMINSKMQILPVYYTPRITVAVTNGNTVNCPDVIEPVCGSDGKTYLNSCYAEAAGVTDYTLGVCYTDCIDPGQINPDAECAAEVAPVCGCNNVTYSNPCLAEAAGVTVYSSGPCKTDTEERSCYDPILVLQSKGTNLDAETGVITLDCNNANQPVCGCNGITYRNACIAEAAGIAFYTPGSCNTSCIDPTKINPDAGCTQTYNPVCGCNGVTYSNSCTAAAAGVVSYVQGPCGQTSAWCDEAIPIQCGDFLAQETTESAGNQIAQYPGCNSNNFLGQDRVYVFEKTTPGDLQIGLEILTPGIDLDLFLLRGSCSQVSCIKASTTNNQNTNNEGIIVPNAPLGTYYIVVDAQYANIAGKFRLEVNCGYLYCAKAQELTCGETFKYNNSFGSDDVSLYTCGTNVYNVENNGPEVVHTFTTTTAGDVTVTLSGLSANLELFLLGECDRGECMRYSENPGTGNEQISAYLEPGTYYVVVDGYNGATSDYSLLVECQNTCDLTITQLTATPSICGSNNGTIDVTTSGGTPGYLVYYSGPVSGSFSTAGNHSTIQQLPPGAYEIRKIDSRGCSATETVTIYSSGGIDADLTPQDAICNEPGVLGIVIKNGKSPYKVYLSGPENAEIDIASSSFSLSGLEPGAYTVYIVDANGCSVTKKATIQKAESNFSFELTPYPAGCGDLGYVRVVTRNGQAPYSIDLSGPVGGKASAQSNVFNITKLPGGTYKLTLEDANQCSYTGSFTIGDISLDVATTVTNGICGLAGELKVQITNGAADYTIQWTGPVSGSVTTSDATYVIPDLPSGSYQIEVSDAKQCTGYDVAEVINSGENLTTRLSPIDGVCGADGSLLAEMENGVPPYQLNWEGPVSGQAQTDKDNLNIPDLPEGLYQVTITDNNGCSDTQSAYVNKEEQVNISLTGVNGNCGQQGAIAVAITEGKAGYIINWSGPIAGSTTTGEKSFDITGLPSGSYKVVVTDANGCSADGAIDIENAEGFLVLEATVSPANCEQEGSLALEVSGGAAGYEVKWEGPVTGSGQTDAAGKLTIADLPAGTYKLSATDQNGCTGAAEFKVDASDGNLSITLTANDPVCSQSGSIVVNISAGSPEYSIRWEGPVSGSGTTGTGNFLIGDLPSGAYKVTVADQFGCQAVDNITLKPTGELDFSAKVVNAACGQGDIELAITKGSPVFNIRWDGPVKGNTTVANAAYAITALPDGTYKISISDQNGCTDEAEVKVYSGTTPKVIATAKPGLCNANGAIGVSISGGTPDFTIAWNGPKDGATTLNANYYEIGDLPGGNYNILITDGNGCTDELTIDLVNETTDLSVQAALAESECGQPNIIAVAISGGRPAYSVKWTGPQSGSQSTGLQEYEIPDLPPGDYQVEVIDEAGCTASTSITIQPSQVDLISLSTEPGLCGRYGAIVVQIPTGQPPYRISWTGPVSGNASTNAPYMTLFNLPTGDYTVLVTDANGCSEAQSIYLQNIESDLALDIDIVDNQCGQPYLAAIKIQGGKPGYKLEWSGQLSGSVNLNETSHELELLPGAYNFKVTDSQGCSASTSVNVQTQAIDLLSLNASLGKCGDPGAILVTIEGGTAAYTISWDGPGSGSATTNEAAYVIPNLPGGDYTVSLTDANGCTDEEQISLETTTALDVDIAGTDGACLDAPFIRLVVNSGSPGFAISWEGPVSGSTTTTSSTYDITGLTAGSFTVKVIDARGCEQSETIQLNSIDNSLELDAEAQNGNCGGAGSIALSISGGSPDYLIAWSGPASGSTSTTSSSHTIEELPSGQYSVSVTDANGCTDETQISLQNSAALEAEVTGTDGDCAESPFILISISSGAPGYAISWDGPLSGNANINAAEYSIPDLAAGSYTVSITDANGCTYSETVQLAGGGSKPELTATAQNGDCGDAGSIALSISSGSPDYLIEWDGPASGSTSTASTSHTIEDLPSGQYSVSITDANGCTDEAQVSLENSAALEVNVTGANGDCTDAPFILVSISSGAPGYAISWNGPLSGSININNGGYSIQNLTAGSYTVSITDANGCTYTETVQLTGGGSKPELTATAQNGDCGDAGSIALGISGGSPNYSISWNGPASGGFITSSTSHTIEDLPSGQYSITVTDANGCTDAVQVNLQNSAALEVEVTGTDGDCTDAPSILVSISSGAPGYLITWNGPVSGSVNTNDAGYTIQDLTTGNYTVEVTDANGCTYSESVQLAGGGSKPELTASAQNGDCGNAGSIVLTFSGGSPNYLLEWDGPVSGSTSTALMSHTVEDLPSGQYNLTVTDANGCTDEAQISLQNSAALEVDITGTDGDCTNAPFILLSISSGSPGYTITWDGPVSGSVNTNDAEHTIQDLTAGSYTVEVTDANGCTYSESVELTGSGSKPEMTVTAQDGSCGDAGAIVVTVSGGTPDYFIEWNGPASGNIITSSTSYTIEDLPAGQYTLNLIDENGCADETQISLQSTGALEADISGTDGGCYEGPFIRIEISKGAPGYTISWEGPVSGSTTTNNSGYTIPDLTAGEYTVKVTDAAGCEQSETVEINGEESKLRLEAKAQDGNCGSTASIALIISGGSPDYLIEWSGPVSGSISTASNDHTIEDLPAGAYTINVTDAGGCVTAAVGEVEVQQGLNVTIEAIPGACGTAAGIRVEYSGEAPFTVSWTGPENGSQTVNDDTYLIPDLESGLYEVKVTDPNGCAHVESVQVQAVDNDLNFTLTTDVGACNEPGAIIVDISGGSPNFVIKWNSVNAKGTATITNRSFTIPELPGGLYDITVTDASGCAQEKTVQLVTHINTVSLSSSVVHPSCEGAKGSITLNIGGDFPGFTITWTGPSSGTASSGPGTYTIPNLEAGAYTVEVSDVNGCSRSETITLNNQTTSPDAFFTYEADVLSVSFSHSGNTGEYLWDFGDGTTSTEADPVHDFAQAGTYLVCLRLTNGCGTTKYCTNVMLSVPEDAVVLDVGEKEAAAAAIVQIPVTVDRLSRLVSLSGSIQIVDPTVAQIKGLAPGKIAPQYNNQQKTFIYYHNGGEGVALQSKDVLFYIELQVIGAPGESSDIKLVDTPLAIEVGGLENGLAVIKPHLSLSGRISVAEYATVAGRISTYWGEAIPGAQVEISGPNLTTTSITDEQGDFALPDLEPGQEYTVRARRDIFPFNGLSTYSLFIGQRFILGKDPLQITSPYQIIAGDANCNGSFSTLDLFIIQQLIIGATEKFSYCPSWVFVSSESEMPDEFDAYNVFPYPNYQTLMVNSDTVANFVGVKVGDILGQANPQAFVSTPEIEERSPVYLDLQAEDQTVKKGAVVSLTISSEEFSDIVSYQFGLEFDPAALSFIDFEAATHEELSGAVAGATLAARGQLALSWFSKQGVGVDAAAGEGLFTLRFEALRDIEKLEGLISVEDLPIRAEAHDGAGERYKPRLSWQAENGKEPQVLSFKLYQNIPNPAKRQTEIRFDLPEAADGELILHDNLGRIVYRQNGTFVPGRNRLTIPLDQLKGGVYYYTLNAGAHTASRSMIVVE